jgi:hypothetical protein
MSAIIFVGRSNRILNNGRLTLGDGQHMKLDENPFPVDMINFEENKIFVWTSQASTTKGKRYCVRWTKGQDDKAPTTRGGCLEGERTQKEAIRVESNVQFSSGEIPTGTRAGRL